MPTALITGASRGIGREVARAQQGAASILWGVDLGPDGPTGGMFEDGEPIA